MEVEQRGSKDAKKLKDCAFEQCSLDAKDLKSMRQQTDPKVVMRIAQNPDNLIQKSATRNVFDHYKIYKS